MALSRMTLHHLFKAKYQKEPLFAYMKESVIESDWLKVRALDKLALNFSTGRSIAIVKYIPCVWRDNIWQEEIYVDKHC